MSILVSIIAIIAVFIAEFILWQIGGEVQIIGTGVLIAVIFLCIWIFGDGLSASFGSLELGNTLLFIGCIIVGIPWLWTKFKN